MAADLNLLVPKLKTLVVELLTTCKASGCEMRPNYGLRDPFEQARLWRQSRSIEEIQSRILSFRTQGANFLADCIESVGPQHGDHATDTPPGFSWHQWGEAVDCFWVVDGKAEWSTKKLVGGVNGYHVYADRAEALGLTAGGHWPKFKDWGHVQLRPENNAGAVLSVVDIDSEMRKRFG